VAADKTPYGPKSKVNYADPGYQSDGKARYPLDSEAHCRAAWAYINMPKNAAKYDAKHLDLIKGRIREALKKYGVDVSEDSGSGEMAVGMADADQGTLLAGAAPLAPPSAWFANPGLKGPTRLTIDEDGHVYGHLAQWKVCHVGIGNSCVMAPKTRTEYSLFRQGTVICDDGTEAPIGKITLGTGHANERWGIMPSREHYDNTGWAAAVVNVGEDRHGIWVNGALTNTMTPERIAELRAASLSGDWRSVNGNLELIAALAVNNPGFPVYREQENRAFSLMAVGVVGAEEDSEYQGEFNMDQDPESAVESQLENEDPELSARIARWNDIEEDLEAHNQDRRAALLASLDEERGELARPTSGKFTPDNEIFIQYNARFRQLQE
jgi:hypothetical protein